MLSLNWQWMNGLILSISNNLSKFFGLRGFVELDNGSRVLDSSPGLLASRRGSFIADMVVSFRVGGKPFRVAALLLENSHVGQRGRFVGQWFPLGTGGFASLATNILLVAGQHSSILRSASSAQERQC
ncbi:MAG TPA: hypothetical protein P5205_08295 [Candidatus Paceibacterota bacterium]|nr:hypothetical protein [Verrucomicrobiota bacterium]HSA10359.1 hypothetical protein [Candidatus Paceibacterota bacterium]